MATRGVKITGLNNLDTVNGNIIIPVVDPTITLATPDGETLQSNVNQIGNFILNEAGNLFPTANVANTVKNNAQPNITESWLGGWFTFIWFFLKVLGFFYFFVFVS